ncbi:MAG: hypothetical protein AAFV53_09195 [Myxococcota bacterium]
MIVVKHRQNSPEKLLKKFPGAAIFDLTSRGPDPWVRLSPFYPHGGIPVPFSPGVTSQSVEGVWQGLKVFASEDVDPARFQITTMKGLKRTVRKYGAVRGHRKGVSGQTLLRYGEAREQIYLPTYRWMLDHKAADLLVALRQAARQQTVILLDYETNVDVGDLSRPLSHAGLVAAAVEGRW